MTNFEINFQLNVNFGLIEKILIKNLEFSHCVECHKFTRNSMHQCQIESNLANVKEFNQSIILFKNYKTENWFPFPF